MEEDRALRPRTLKILHIVPSHSSWQRSNLLESSGEKAMGAMTAGRSTPELQASPLGNNYVRADDAN